MELNGTRGSLVFDLEDLNTLQVYDAADGANAGFRRILVTEPTHPYVGAWWPPGHLLGYEHGFTHQVVDLVDGHLRRTSSRRPRSPTASACSASWPRSSEARQPMPAGPT